MCEMPTAVTLITMINIIIVIDVNHDQYLCCKNITVIIIRIGVIEYTNYVCYYGNDIDNDIRYHLLVVD